MTTADELIAEARSRTGLTDLGPDSFHDGLVALFEGAEAAGSLNELGVAVLRDQAIELLSTRLSIEDWYRRHPEIDEQEIDAPLFGLGLPRTGSTALSFLLAEDPRCRSLLTWETNSPTPPPEPETYETDPRIEEAAIRISFVDELAPKFKVMLPMAAAGPNECLQILALDFRSAVFQALGDNPGYERWFAACDMVSAYEYHRRVLKLLQWKFPTRPWRLKSPAHMHSIGALAQVYPDASFVMTHRDIAQVIPSVVSLLDATSDLLRDGALPDDFAVRQAEFWERGLRTTLAFRDGGEESRFFDLGFDELRPDPLPAVGRLYHWLGMELTDEVADRMRAWWSSNPADKHGVHEYRPEQYGIDLDQIRDQFAFYNDRFAVA
ncbi:MAG TPA: sulfotransferase [Microthrixaceae bacterium]|nr:sulfotransferase [Microthrixaceae bacterium]